MKKLITQFDSQKHGVYVTTPSCCGCCCCCCCSLATSITSSTLLARRINHEAKEHQVPNRGLYVALAALFLPVAGLISYLLITFLDKSFQYCRTITYPATRYSPERVYDQCVSTATNFYWVIIAFVFIGLLAFLYGKVKMQYAIGRAILVAASIAILLVAEAWIGAMLILTSAGLGYLIAIPFLFGAVYKLYDVTFGRDIVARRHGTEAAEKSAAFNVSPSITPAYPSDDQPPLPTANPDPEDTNDKWKSTLN